MLALGGLLMNEDLDVIFTANEKLNRAGMDAISAGGTIAFAMECFQRGILNLSDTDGLDLSWGNSQSILTLLDLMIAREGIGALLADGSLAAARRIGKGSAAFAIQAGGQELPMHDGRNDPGYALHAVVEPTPGRHTLGSYQYYEMFQLWRKTEITAACKTALLSERHKIQRGGRKSAMGSGEQSFYGLLNAAGGCLFGAFLGVHRYPIFEWLNAVAGWQKTPQEYLHIGWRIQTLRQL